MKKTLFLAVALGLTTWCTPIHAEERTWTEVVWADASDVEDRPLEKNTKLIINLGNSEEAYDLGSVCIWNNVINKTKNYIESGETSINVNISPDDENAEWKTYTYGALEIAAGANVQFKSNKDTDSGGQNDNRQYTSAGTLAVQENARLTISDRVLTITGLPYTSLGSGATIVLDAPNANEKSGGILSMGISAVTGTPADSQRNAVIVKGANHGSGYITNTSDTIAELGGQNAANVEYHNVNIQIQGTQDTTISAKLKNATIVNGTQGKTVYITGGTVQSEPAVTQINTGDHVTGGNVVLLNRETTQNMDALRIADGRTITAKQGDQITSESALIKLNAYRSENLDSNDVNFPIEDAYGLETGAGATLDAHLELGTGNRDEVVFFTPYVGAFDYMETPDIISDTKPYAYGLNLAGNNLTLNSGILLYDGLTSTPEAPAEILLFTNVNSLTLKDMVYDDLYFDYKSQIAASTYFSTNYQLSDAQWYFGSVEAPVITEDSVSGWYIEYRNNGNGTGNVYLAYNTLNIPEPTSTMLGLVGMVALSFRRRRK